MTNLLFIHGILGHPGHFNFLYPCVPEDYNIVKLLLPGHGGSVQDFSNASMRQWRKQVADTVNGLRQDNDKLLIIAHSMGTLFAIEEAVKGNADGLFLLNPPMSLRITRRMFTTPFKVMTGNINDKWTKAAKDAYSITDDSNLFHYMGWIPRYLELFQEIHNVKSIANLVSIPTHIFLSIHDEMVSLKSAHSFANNPEVHITKLPDSGHYYYSESDILLMKNDFIDFIKSMFTFGIR